MTKDAKMKIENIILLITGLVSVVSWKFSSMGIQRLSGTQFNAFPNLPLKLSRESDFEMDGNKFSVLNSYLKITDFSKVLEALRCYKDIYGDFKIDTKFVVPSQPPWPQTTQGLKLGQLLERYLSSKEFFQLHPEKVKSLVDVGFEPKLENMVSEWDVILMTLKTYKEVYGNLRVRQDFIVPDEDPWPRYSRNMKFGTRVSGIRSSGRRVANHPERKALLDEMGFVWHTGEDNEREEMEFEKICHMLSIYKDHFGDVDVPPDFVVSSDNKEGLNWPEEYLQYHLGETVGRIREAKEFVQGKRVRRQLLTDLGFNWSCSRTAKRKQDKFESIYSILKTYHSIYGNVSIPHYFRVPSTPPWDESLAGIHVGPRLRVLRVNGPDALDEEKRRRLQDLGFVWSTKVYQKATEKYDLKFGMDSNNETKITKEIDLPSVDKQVTAPHLGNQPNFEKMDKTTLRESRRQLKRQEWDQLLELKKSYKKFEVSQIFDPSPVREQNAAKLLDAMHERENSPDPAIRKMVCVNDQMTVDKMNEALSMQFSQDDIRIMKEKGYRMFEFGPFSWAQVLDALKIYKQLYDDVEVPRDFVINQKIIDLGVGFNVSLLNMDLGDIVFRIRTGDSDGLEDPERRTALDEIGFEWGDLHRHQRYRFVPMILGLRVYLHLFGNTMLQSDYCIPEDENEVIWPYWMINMPLGKWTSIIRAQQQMVAKFYPERKEMLDDMKFAWWLPPNLPDKFYEGLK